MSNYVDLIRELAEVSQNPKQAVIKAMKETGKKAIGCFPYFTPDEIIYAAGYLPVGMWGGNTQFKLADQFLQNFCCSIMRANLEYAMGGTYDMLSAVVITNYCDSLKALCKNWPYAVKNIPVMGIAYPQNRIPAAATYLVDEFKFFKKRLEDMSGQEIFEEALDESFEIYESYREACRQFTGIVKDYPVTLNAKTRHHILKAAYFMDKKTYTEKIKAIIDELKHQPKEEIDDFKVILSGIMVDSEAYLDVLVDNNITVVGDDLVQESQQFRTISRTTGNTLERMAGRFIDLKGCSLVYEPEKSRGQMLINMKNELGADGVIGCQLKFCEPEEFDYPIYKVEMERAGVKLLYIEADQQIQAPGQIANRIQTFVEINKR